MTGRLVVLVGVGTRGDVQPLVALAQRFISVGWRARLVTHASWAFLVEGTGIELAPIATADPRLNFASDLAARQPSLAGRAIQLGVRQHAYPERDQVLEACRGGDLIVFSQMYWPAAHIAEYLRVPAAAAYLVPYYSTAAFPRPVGPLRLHRRNLGGLYNVLTHKVFEWRNDAADIPPLNTWRRSHGLPPVRRQEQWADERRIPRFYGFSTCFLPRPSDWPEWHHVTGYWFWDQPDWRPTERLEAFLSSPTAFVGFSSSIVDGVRLLAPIVAGLRALGLRVLVAPGWSCLDIGNDPEVQEVEPLPFSWVFARVAVAVHAGGAGTIGEILRAGKPSVCIPMFGDQKFNAARLERLGVAPEPIDRERVTAGTVVAATQQALKDGSMSVKAAELAVCIARDDGAGAVVRTLTSIWS